MPVVKRHPLRSVSRIWRYQTHLGMGLPLVQQIKVNLSVYVSTHTRFEIHLSLFAS
jgi:hypothetical protein